MVIKAKEFKFRGDKITCQPTEYTINWCDFMGEPTVTISRLDGTFSNKQLKFSAKDIPLFIKELQTLTEFMKNDGLLVEDEEEDEEEDEDEDQ
jgi:hypothetical protein